MKTWIAKWPDGTISIVRAKNKAEAFWIFDEEGSPTHAEIFQITTESFHIMTDVEQDKIKFSFGDETSKRKVKFGAELMFKGLAV